jgi:hypothetical protein
VSYPSLRGASATTNICNRDLTHRHATSLQVPVALRLRKRSIAGNDEGRQAAGNDASQLQQPHSSVEQTSHPGATKDPGATADKRAPPVTRSSAGAHRDAWSADYPTGARHAAYAKARRVLTPAQLGALYELTQRARPLKRLQRAADMYAKRGQAPPPPVAAALRRAEAARTARLRFGVHVARLLGQLGRPSAPGSAAALDAFVARTVQRLDAELGAGALERFGAEILRGQRGQPGGRLGMAPAEAWPAAVERLVAEAEAHEAAGERSWLRKHKSPQAVRAGFFFVC